MLLDWIEIFVYIIMCGYILKNIIPPRLYCKLKIHTWYYWNTSHDYRRTCQHCKKEQLRLIPWQKWTDVASTKKAHSKKAI